MLRGVFEIQYLMKIVKPQKNKQLFFCGFFCACGIRIHRIIRFSRFLCIKKWARNKEISKIL